MIIVMKRSLVSILVAISTFALIPIEGRSISIKRVADTNQKLDEWGEVVEDGNTLDEVLHLLRKQKRDCRKMEFPRSLECEQETQAQGIPPPRVGRDHRPDRELSLRSAIPPPRMGRREAEPPYGPRREAHGERKDDSHSALINSRRASSEASLKGLVSALCDGDDQKCIRAVHELEMLVEVEKFLDELKISEQNL